MESRHEEILCIIRNTTVLFRLLITLGINSFNVISNLILLKFSVCTNSVSLHYATAALPIQDIIKAAPTNGIMGQRHVRCCGKDTWPALEKFIGSILTALSSSYIFYTTSRRSLQCCEMFVLVVILCETLLRTSTSYNRISSYRDFRKHSHLYNMIL